MEISVVSASLMRIPLVKQIAPIVQHGSNVNLKVRVLSFLLIGVIELPDEFVHLLSDKVEVLRDLSYLLIIENPALNNASQT